MITAELSAIGATLLHHQCWAWGADVRREAGNLLLRYGFEREAPGDSRRYSSVRRGRAIVLWPFGIGFQTQPGAGVFLQRFTCEPEAVSLESMKSAWNSEQLGASCPIDREGQLRLLRETVSAMRWISAYERWVAGVAGCDYRDQTLAPWPQATLGAAELLRGWERMARDLELRLLQCSEGYPAFELRAALGPSSRDHTTLAPT